MPYDRSVDSLIRALEAEASGGEITASTVSSYKTAINKVLSVLTNAEALDVTGLNLDAVFAKFRRQYGRDYEEVTLGAYEARIRASIAILEKRLGEGSGKRPDVVMPKAPTVLPIPIRPDLTIEVLGLPFDLTSGEAKKIANVVLAMVAD